MTYIWYTLLFLETCYCCCFVSFFFVCLFVCLFLFLFFVIFCLFVLLCFVFVCLFCFLVIVISYALHFKCFSIKTCLQQSTSSSYWCKNTTLEYPIKHLNLDSISWTFNSVVFCNESILSIYSAYWPPIKMNCGICANAQ